MDNQKTLKIIDKNGNKTEYEILCAFELAQTEKNYIVFTDNTKDENGNLNVFASIYYPDNDTKLDEIETEEEWKIIESIIQQLIQEKRGHV